MHSGSLISAKLYLYLCALRGLKFILSMVMYLILSLSVIPKYEDFFGLILLSILFLKEALDRDSLVMMLSLFQSTIVDGKNDVFTIFLLQGMFFKSYLL